LHSDVDGFDAAQNDARLGQKNATIQVDRTLHPTSHLQIAAAIHVAKDGAGFTQD
jgi:hypothetical protein